MADPIEVYLRANQSNYPREVITERLSAAGYERAAIDEVWDRIAASLAYASLTSFDKYLRANSSRYPREALNAQLLAAGYDRAAIEAGWRRLSTWLSLDGSSGEGVSPPRNQRLVSDLRAATKDWTLPVIVRTYDSMATRGASADR